MSEWVEYGDVNPLSHGGIWARKDVDSDTRFDIVMLTLSGEEGEDGEEQYYVNSGFVDLTDSWIDWVAVIDAPLTLGSVESNMNNAIEAAHYYGLIEFGGNYGGEYVDADVAIAELKAYGIEV